MAEKESMFPDYSRPASVLGFYIPISIPIKRESGRQTYAIVTAHVEFNQYGEQQVKILQNSRTLINRLGKDSDKIFKYIVGIAMATHNVAASMTRKRWFKIAPKAD